MMTKPLLLILSLIVPLATAACDRGPGDRDAGRGPYVSGGFGGH